MNEIFQNIKEMSGLLLAIPQGRDINEPGAGSVSLVTVADDGSISVAERVVAYLHHGSLDRTPEEPFMPPETDPRFFTKSTTEPPAATPPSGAKP